MENYICLRDRPDLSARAAAWFHQKWGIPLAAYEESIAACLRGGVIPQWYLVMENGQIIAGLGCIENDFHLRRDLTPNLCAVYVEESARGRGIARRMLDFACADLKNRGVSCVYLLTDHTSFYEKCGFAFYCMAEEEGGGTSRMYRRSL